MFRLLPLIYVSLLCSCNSSKSIVITQAADNVPFALLKLRTTLPADTLAHFVCDSIYFIEAVDVNLNKVKRKDAIKLSINNDSVWIIFLGEDLKDGDSIDIKWDHINNRLVFINHKRIPQKLLRNHKNWR